MTDNQASTESPDTAWRRLHRHLDRANSFWLGFVFAPDLHGAEVLCERAEWNCRRRGAPFLRLVPQTPQELSRLTEVLEVESPGPGGCTWIAAAHIGQHLATGDDWSDAWTVFLQTLNHRRDTLRRKIGGLVLAIPPAAKHSAMTVSTDLWSVRDYLTELTLVLDPSVGPAWDLPESDTPASLSKRPVRRLRGITFDDHSRSESDQRELLSLLASVGSELTTEVTDRLNTGINAAFARGDDQAAGTLLAQLGLAEMDDDPWAAYGHLHQALDTPIPVRLRLTVLESLSDLAMAFSYTSEALQLAKASFEVAEQLGDIRSAAITQSKIADILEARGELDQALALHQQALTLFERLGDVREAAITQSKIADIHRSRGNYDQALALHQQALTLFERLGDVREAAITQGKIADIHEARGNLDQALRIRLEQELPVYDKIGDIVSATATRFKIAMGAMQLNHIDPDVLDGVLTHCFEQFLELQIPDGITTTGFHLAQVRAARGGHASATEILDIVEAIFTTLGDETGLARCRELRRSWETE